MKLTFLTLTMAAQLAASVAMAQTSDGTTATPGAMATSGTFGSDWSTSLSSAMFGEDGTTVRPDSEIEAQWATLSEEDRTMIRRDCMVFMQGAGAETEGDVSGAATTADTTAGSDTSGATSMGGAAATDTDATETDTTGTAATESDGAVGTTGTDATGTADTSAADTGTADTGGAAPGTAESAAPGADASGAADSGMAGDTSVTGMMDVSAENMEAICAATTNL